MAAPRPPDSYQKWISRFDWIAAIGLTVAAIVLQVINFRHAGGLWRDEAAAVNLAQMPSWSAIWAHVEHESFPLLITAVIRIWTAIGFGGTDAALRTLGLVISASLLAALWWSTWRLTLRPPLVSLLLVGLSAVALRWGGSLRAYGLGVSLALVMLSAIWQVVERNTLRRLAVAMAASVLAVQALYQNALVLLAVCASAGLIALIRRDGKLAGAVAIVGVVSALSLVPYAGVITRASEWNEATAVAIDIERIWTVLYRAVAASGSWMPWLWGAAIAVFVVVAVRSAFRQQRGESGRGAELSIYLLGTVIGTTVGYYLFLKVTRFPTEEWYYLLWMGVAAVAIDARLITAWRSRETRIVATMLVVIAAGFAVPAAAAAVRVRATNVDLIAARLSGATTPKDVVIVHPWFCAVSLARYYTGPAKLLPLPPLSDIKLQRLDLVKEQMRNEATLQPVLAEIEAALRIGGNVWLIGHYPFANPPQPAPVLPRAGEGPEGWRAAPYMAAYGMEVAYFLQMHALQSERVDVAADQRVHPFENLPVRVLSGWRRSRGAW